MPKVLDLSNDGGGSFVSKATDPVISPTYASPADFAAQYPTPLDTTELIAMCEEVSTYQAIPELTTALKQETWRELNSLAFTSGSSYISFADGSCPEEYTHDGTNTTVTLKYIGAKKTLSDSDIMHSQAIAAASWNGINAITGAAPASAGSPGGYDMGTFQREVVADVKEKEIRLATTLVLNGWDKMLITGDSASNSLEFDGIETQVTAGNGAHVNTDVSGTFSATTFDRFLSESCARPTHIFGHPAALQEMQSAFFQLGYQGSQIVNYANGDRVTPGFNFAAEVNTGVGRLGLVADSNFTRTDLGGAFQSNLFALRMTHNGEPLVYRRTQIPLGYKDLQPGCTAVSFEVVAKTALIIKHKCAHGRYGASFTGNIAATCPTIG